LKATIQGPAFSQFLCQPLPASSNDDDAYVYDAWPTGSTDFAEAPVRVDELADLGAVQLVAAKFHSVSEERKDDRSMSKQHLGTLTEAV
jgi:hypothetical protein